MGKKNWPKKGHYPKRGPNCPKLVFPVCQVKIPRNHMYSPNLKRNGWKLLHLSLTALSGTQNVPIPIVPLRGKNRNLGPDHLLDIITKEKPAKSQIKWTTASKVMRHRNFCAPKGSVPEKGHKCAQYAIFEFSRWRYQLIMSTGQIWSRTVENCSIYDRPHFLGPKITPFP